MILTEKVKYEQIKIIEVHRSIYEHIKIHEYTNTNLVQVRQWPESGSVQCSSPDICKYCSVNYLAISIGICSCFVLTRSVRKSGLELSLPNVHCLSAAEGVILNAGVTSSSPSACRLLV